ncbi:MAG: hypothetical protein AAFX93_11180 [Verrucomicrobiota bacterium]
MLFLRSLDLTKITFYYFFIISIVFGITHQLASQALPVPDYENISNGNRFRSDQEVSFNARVEDATGDVKSIILRVNGIEVPGVVIPEFSITNADFVSNDTWFGIKSNGMIRELLYKGRLLFTTRTRIDMINSSGNYVKLAVPDVMTPTVTDDTVSFDEEFFSNGRTFRYRTTYTLVDNAIRFRAEIANTGGSLNFGRIAITLPKSQYETHEYVVDGETRSYGTNLSRRHVNSYQASTTPGYNFKFQNFVEGSEISIFENDDRYILTLYANASDVIEFDIQFPQGGEWSRGGITTSRIANGSFETGFNKWGVDFNNRDLDSRKRIVTDEKLHGRQSLQLDLVRRSGFQNKAKVTSEYFQAPFQSEINLRAYLKANRENVKVTMGVRYYPIEAILNQDAISITSEEITLSTEWQPINFSTVLPRSLQGAYCIFFEINGGTSDAVVHIDRVTVTDDAREGYVHYSPVECSGDTAASDNLWEPDQVIPISSFVRNNRNEDLTLTILLDILDPFYHRVVRRTITKTVPAYSTITDVFNSNQIRLSKRGAHRAYIRAFYEDGTLAAQQGFTIGILEERTTFNVRPEGRFGANIRMQGGNYWQYLDYASRIGFTWTRAVTNFGWENIQPTEGGPLEFNSIENSLADHEVRGLTPIAIVRGIPRWASAAPAGASKYNNYPPKNAYMDDFQSFLTQLSDRYKDRVFFYEIWNEPELSKFYRGTPTQFGEILKRAFWGINAGSPDAEIAAFGLTDYPSGARPFLRSVFDSLGTNEFCDSVAWHPYRQGRKGPEETNMRSEFNMIQSDIQEYGDAKDLQATEIGWFAPEKWSVPYTPFKNSQIPEHIATEEECARWYSQMAVTAFAHRVQSFIYFTFTEGDISDRWFHGFIGPNSRSLKSVFFSSAACIRNTDFGDIIDQRFHFSNLYTTEFRHPDKDVLVLWAKQGGIDIEIDTDVPIDGEDLYGNAFQLHPKNGKVWLTVTEDVLYLKTSRSGIQLRQASFALRERERIISPGSTVELGINGNLPAGTTLEVDSGFVGSSQIISTPASFTLTPRNRVIPNNRYQVLGEIRSGETVNGLIQWSVIPGQYKGAVDLPVNL